MKEPYFPSAIVLFERRSDNDGPKREIGWTVLRSLKLIHSRIRNELDDPVLV